MKIRYSLLILLAIVSTSIAITAIVGTNLIKEQATEIAFVENPKLKASTEMEVELNQITNSIFAVMENRPQLSEIDKNIADYDRFREQYETFPLSSNEKESLAKLDTLTLQFRNIGTQLIDVHTEKQEKSHERIEIFDGSVRDILIKTLKPDLDPSEIQYDIKAQALNEIDINIHEAISASRGYQITQELFLKDVISEAISELRFFTIQFDQAELAENQRDLFDLLKPDIESIIVLTEGIIELEDSRLLLLEELDSTLRPIDSILDDEIQAVAEKGQVGEDKPLIATDMELEISQIRNAVFAIMEQRTPFEPLDEHIADYQLDREQFRSLIQTDTEKQILAKLDTLFFEYEAIVWKLIAVSEEKQEKSLERIEIFDGNVRDILIQTLKPDLDPSEIQYDIKAQALNEIDINIHEAISASRGYEISPEPFLKDVISEAISELRFFTIQFDQAELTKIQHEQFDLLKPDIESIIVLTDGIIELEDSRLLLLEDFDRSFLQIDSVLDKEIQASSNTKIQAATELESEIVQITNSIFAVMENRPQLSEIDKNIADYNGFREIYQSLIQTDIEREELAKLDTLFLQYHAIGDQLISVHTEKQEKSLERIEIFDGNVRDILIQTLKPDLDPSEIQYDIKAQALNEIDINIHEAISASRGYQIAPEPFLKDVITEAMSELRFFTIQFDQAELAENQRDLFDLLKPDIESIIVLTEGIIELEDSRLALLIQFDSSRLQISRVLDQEIQAIATQHVQEGQEKTKDTIDQILISLVVIFIIMLVSGFVYAFRIGSRTEKLIEVTTEIVKGNYEVKAPSKQTDEIGILGKALNEMSSKLKAANIQQEQFAAMITHELKTPLVPIKGYCEMLLNPKFGELTQDQKEAVEEILQNASQLQGLIQNVLSAQKLGVDAMKYNYEDIDVDEYIEQIFKTLTPYMTDKKINFTKSIQKGMKMKADKSKLIEVFTNTVQNSVDFVPDVDGKITIAAISKGRQIQFSVTDNGIGMPKEKQKKLFQKFYQVDTSHTRKHGGSGLGLSICKGYIEDMHGNIWIESEEGKGTTIFFTLPMVN